MVLGASQTWTNNSSNPTTVSGTISGSGGLTVAGIGTLMLPGTHNIGSLAGAAGSTVDLAGGALTAGGNNASTTFAGQIIDSTGGTTSSFTKVGNGTLTLAGALTYSGNTNVSGGTLVMSSGNNSIGSNGGNVTVNGAGAVLQITGITTVAAGISTAVSGGGTLAITGQYTTTNANQLIGAGAGVGTVVLSSTGYWTDIDNNQSYSVFMVGGNGNNGTLIVNDQATLDLTQKIFGTLGIAYGGSGNGRVIQNGGHVITFSPADAWNGPTGPGVIMGGFAANSYAEYDLNGGTLSTPNVYNVYTNSKGVLSPDPAGETSLFYFNGGVLQATQGDDSFSQYMIAEGSNHLMGNLTHAYVQADGAIIDTNGFSTSINQSLEHSGTGSDGGLLVTGGGTLTLLLPGTFTGRTLVQQGTTLAIADSGGFAIAMSTLDTSGTGTLDVTALTAVTLGGLSGPGPRRSWPRPRSR